MKNVNFLPPEVQRAQRVQAEQWLWLVALAVCGLLIAVSSVLHATSYWAARWERQRLEPLCRAARQLEQDYQALTGELEHWTRRARLYALLENSWPRSRLLGIVWEAMPGGVLLTRVTLERSRSTLPPASMSSVQLPGQNSDTLDAAEEDFQRLYQYRQQNSLVLVVEGTTRDSSTLHPFLDRLQQSPLVTAAKLESLKADVKSQDQGLSFVIRATVRPEFGLPGGPSAQDATPSQERG